VCVVCCPMEDGPVLKHFAVQLSWTLITSVTDIFSTLVRTVDSIWP
jgi:hypothetical protein